MQIKEKGVEYIFRKWRRNRSKKKKKMKKEKKDNGRDRSKEHEKRWRNGIRRVKE